MTDCELTWAEHAEGLRSEQLALAMLKALISPDEDELDVVLADLEEIGDQALEQFQTSLADLAIRFGVACFGDLDGLRKVLEELQADLAQHIAEYQP
jgi:hypothetical protein